MRSSFPVPVTLHRTATSVQMAVVFVYTNQRGQLPVVLINPVGRDGRVTHGEWINDDLGGKIQDTSYVRLRDRDLGRTAGRATEVPAPECNGPASQR